MPRWLRVIRGMIGTGLTFAAGVGVVGSILGLVGLLLGELSWDDLRMVAKLSVVAFLVGVGFSGVLAIAARGRRLETLSLRYVTALGAGGGLLYFLFIAAAIGAGVAGELPADGAAMPAQRPRDVRRAESQPPQ